MFKMTIILAIDNFLKEPGFTALSVILAVVLLTLIIRRCKKSKPPTVEHSTPSQSPSQDISVATAPPVYTITQEIHELSYNPSDPPSFDPPSYEDAMTSKY